MSSTSPFPLDSTITHLSFFLSLSATGLSAGQPDHPGPGDPDGALWAYCCQTPGGGGLPVLPQCPGPALLPLQGPPGPIRDPGHQRILPPEGQHNKHHEVWTGLALISIKCSFHFANNVLFSFYYIIVKLYHHWVLSHPQRLRCDYIFRSLFYWVLQCL